MIGLETSTKGAFRNVNPDYQANPPNWITVASETDCNALGIPFDLRQMAQDVSWMRTLWESATYEVISKDPM